MIAVIEPGQIEPDERVIFFDLDAGFAHHRQIARVHFARANPVDEHVDFHGRARPLGQRLGELPADVAGPIDVGFQVDGFPRATNGRKHRGKNPVAVDKRRDAVAGHNAGADQLAHRPEKLRLVHGVFMIELVANPSSVKAGATGNTGKKKQEQAQSKRNPPGGIRSSAPVHCERIVIAQREFPIKET